MSSFQQSGGESRQKHQSRKQKLRVEIYDISGKLISTLINTRQIQGWHSIAWDGTSQQSVLQVPSGLYICTITADEEIKTTNLILLK